MFTFKIPAILIGIAISYALWYVRKVKARKRLEEIDEGRRCVSCDGTDLERAAGHARCLRCGHVVSLASLQAAVVSESELSDITRPENRDRL